MKDIIYITGDTHGDFERLSNRYFRPSDGDYLIICGDFGGIWDNSETDKYWIKWLSEKPFTTLFLDGNHENYDLLSAYPVEQWHGGKIHRICDNVIHLMRGQIFDIDGYRFFVMGGAASHDVSGGILKRSDPLFKEKKRQLAKRKVFFRIEHESWWAEELPSREELDEGEKNLKKFHNRVDFILTHCAPSSVQQKCARRDGGYSYNQLTDYLESIKNSCEFQHWFFGHYHFDGMIDDAFTILYHKIICLEDFISDK